MKKMPLSLQIWALCTGVTLCIFGLIMLSLPHMLNGFFTREVYALLEDSQKSVQIAALSLSHPYLNKGDNQQDKNSITAVEGTVAITPGKNTAKPDNNDTWKDVSSFGLAVSDSAAISFNGAAENEQPSILTVTIANMQDASGTTVIPAVEIIPSIPAGNSSGLPPVNQMLVTNEQKLSQMSNLPPAFIKDIQTQAHSQKQTVQRYSHQEGKQTLLYVIKKQDILGKPGYLLTYAWGSYTRALSGSLMQQLLWLMVALCLISGIPSFFSARYLTRPLVEMESAARRISERNWQEPLVSKRRDEIGRLAHSLDKMRVQLAEQDEAQQSFLQNLSHELKTPAMVISSYAQAILDGIYPRGTMEESVMVIKEESVRLQKRVQDFLYLNKLKYLALHSSENESFALNNLLEETVERLRWQRPDLQWLLDLGEWQIKGSREQWAVALENLLDNQMRYAQNRVEVSVIVEQQDEAHRQLRVFNDGPPIEPDLLEHIFTPYSSGHKGQFGLGLAIFKQVMEMHGTRFRACNEADGVAFYIEPQV